MPQIIGFIGVIGSGKNYQRDLLIKKGFIGLDFKDALIEMCEDIVGFPIRDQYDAFKENVVGIRPSLTGLILPNAMDRQKSKELVTVYPEMMTGRRLLQRVGTEVMRKRDPNYWVNAWVQKANAYVEGGYSVAVADVRFWNEVQAIAQFKLKQDTKVETKCIFCDYRSDRYNASSNHPSEELAQSLLAFGMTDGQELKASLEDIPPKTYRD